MLSKEQCNELYRKHAPGAFGRALRLLGNASDADDMVHDVFLALFERYAQFRGTSELSTYVYAAVTHACLNRLRNQRKRQHLKRIHATELGALPMAASSAEAWVAARDLLARLPEPLGEVALYHHLEELTQREIASLLGCSHAHVAELVERLARWVNRQELATCRS
jgi:RNA polymerase sigma factor (sigma-70 family)